MDFFEKVSEGFNDLVNGMQDTVQTITDTVSETVSGMGDSVTYITSGQFFTDFVNDVLMWVIIAVVAIVVLGAVFDGVRQKIRGLDVSLLGVAFVWIGYKVDGLPMLGSISDPLYALGVSLFVLGIIIFVIVKIVRHNKKRRERQKVRRQVQREDERRFQKELARRDDY